MPQQGKYKTPPYSDEAERSVLGCMMLDRDAVAVALNMLSPEDFYVPRNRWIFSAIKQLNDRGFAADYVTIIDQLTSASFPEKIDPTYLAELQEIVPTTKNIEQYCRIVFEKTALRDIILNFSDIENDCYEDTLSLPAIIDKAEKFIYNLSVNKTRNEFRSLKDETLPVIERISELHQQDSFITGVATGFTELDRMTGGFQPSDLILIAARPSMGKTTLGMNIAQNAAIRDRKTVAFFSLEMSVEQLVMRIIASESAVDSTVIKIGRQNADEWKRIRMFHSRLAESETKLFLDDTSAISTSEVRSKLRKLKSTEGLDLVVIDYLQLMSVKRKIENRQQEISEISRDLKSIAKELNVPLVALSQLSRSPEKRTDARPVLSDLRESGAIEQDADLVLMIYRPYIYDKSADPEGAELNIVKHRNGEVGTVPLRFVGSLTKFSDAPQYQQGENN